MDWEEFRKLFKAPIQVAEHGDYTVALLARSAEWAELPSQVEAFRGFVERTGGRPHQARVAAQQALISALSGSAAYARLQEAELPESRPVHDRRGALSGRMWVVLDLVSANFHTLRRFDDEGALGASWAELCARHAIDPVLASSKSFRQVVFGNLNPKRNQRFQAAVTSGLWSALEGSGREFVYLERDELVIAAGDEGLEPLRAAAEAAAARAPVPVRTFARRWSRIASGEYRVEHWEPGGAAPAWVGLSGVPGNRYLPAFRREVLGEEPDPRDLEFVVDGRKARWLEV